MLTTARYDKLTYAIAVFRNLDFKAQGTYSQILQFATPLMELHETDNDIFCVCLKLVSLLSFSVFFSLFSLSDTDWFVTILQHQNYSPLHLTQCRCVKRYLLVTIVLCVDLTKIQRKELNTFKKIASQALNLRMSQNFCIQMKGLTRYFDWFQLFV